MTDGSSLLQHADFARRLAVGLVREDEADDLVQDAWVDVLRQPPADQRSPRGFLATVLRRGAARGRRGRARRAARERAVARPERLPSSADIAARLEVQRRLVRALDELAEPCRRALMLRYYDDLSPSEIAERSDEPVETVRTRIKRGLAQLRSKLDRQCGGRGGWAAALVPTLQTSAARSVVLGWIVMTTTKRVGLALGSIALVIVGWTVWPKGEPAAEPELPSAGERSASTVAAEAAARSAEPQRRAAADVEPAAPGVIVAGSITALDERGVEHPAEAGTIRFESAGATHDVAVAQGRFELPLAEPRDFAVRTVMLGGRRAWLRRADYPFTRELELLATWYPPLQLRVVDAQTREDLGGVTVLRDLLLIRDRVHPGPWTAANEHVVDGRSPFVLPPASDRDEGVIEYWVGAEGYCWSPVEIAHRAGGERVIALEKGARLKVRLDRFDPEWSMHVRVRDPELKRRASALAEQPAAEVVTFAGLGAGRVQVEAEFGYWWHPPIVVGRGEVELVPGAEVEVDLDLDEAALPPAAVPIAGRIVLPAGFEDLAVSLGIRSVGGPELRKGDLASVGTASMRAVPGVPGAREWGALRLTPGTYLAVVGPLQIVHRFEVSVPHDQVVIEVPPLAAVAVRVIEERTREPLALDRVHWGVPMPRGMTMWSHENVTIDADTGEYRFVAPLTRITIGASSPAFEIEGKGVRVAAGHNQVELIARERPHRWLRMVDGDAQVPFRWALTTTATAVDGSKRGRVVAIEGGRAKIRVPEPGDYRIDFAELDGFEPVEPLIVPFGAGTGEEVVVRLRRKS